MWFMWRPHLKQSAEQNWPSLRRFIACKMTTVLGFAINLYSHKDMLYMPEPDVSDSANDSALCVLRKP
jgi:hypothetical protein